jgi:hypothetical protein
MVLKKHGNVLENSLSLKTLQNTNCVVDLVGWFVPRKKPVSSFVSSLEFREARWTTLGQSVTGTWAVARTGAL